MKNRAEMAAAASTSASLEVSPTPTLYQQFLAACGASITAAVVVNPLDVVKTRLQTQAAGMEALRSQLATAASRGGLPKSRTNLLEKWSHFSCPPTCPRARGVSVDSLVLGACGQGCGTYTSTIGMFRKIARQEGVKVGTWPGWAVWAGSPCHDMPL